jgi:lipopolysaccharide transport system ATP-binding protein
MSSDIAIAISNISKVYEIYNSPQDRLKQMLYPGHNKFYNEFWALKDVSFEVKKGETVGIVGRNGSGKSTLLQIICGTVTPSSGAIERNGRMSALLELGSGFNPEFTGRENVFLNGAIVGLSLSEMENRFDKIAAFADIGDFINIPVKRYSSGMFARLAFSVAVHVDPEILIVDEILAVGDIAFQRKCLNKFYEIRESGCSILFVSHDQYQVKSICQRALYLEGGQQRMFGPADSVIDEYTIEMEGQSVGTPLQSDRSKTDLIESASRKDDETSNEKPSIIDLSSISMFQKKTESQIMDKPDPERLYKITSVILCDAQGTSLDIVNTNQSIYLQFDFVSLNEHQDNHISFVFNLYRHDDLYICGSTTLMDGLAAVLGPSTGRVKIEFPDFPLLSGQYKWRVAINDHVGFVTHAEATGVCEFRVKDNFIAVGMFNLSRKWHLDIQKN